MRRTLNNIFHTIGAGFIVLGFLMLVGAAGASDAEAELAMVTPMINAGLVSVFGGAFLGWWRI